MALQKTRKLPRERVFTSYETFIIAILAVIQFSVILDFMVLSPLGAILLQELDIKTSQFGLVVSGYAFSAGLSGLLTAGFADKFDRKKLLLFFYVGFLAGTLLCAIAPDYHYLLIARIVTGIFGGVISSISFAIITDLFKLEVRGRVMGFVQMAFAASQVLGIPVGLTLANHYGWHSPFWMILGFGFVVGIIMLVYVKPIDAHLKLKSDRNPFHHLFATLTTGPYLRAFGTTTLLATGGFMLMPFGSAFGVNNLGININSLPLFYGIAGVFSIIFGPILGRMADRIGKYKLFFFGTLLGIVMVLIYTRLGIIPFWVAVALNVLLFIAISARMISSSALITAIPESRDRGAFMSINSSVQQLSGGIAAAIAGTIVSQLPSGKIIHYDTLGFVVTGTMIFTLILMYYLNRYIEKKRAGGTEKPIEEGAPGQDISAAAS